MSDENPDRPAVPRPAPSGSQSGVVRVMGIVSAVLTLVFLAVLQGPSKEIGGKIGRLLGQGFHRASTPSSWTPEAKEKLLGLGHRWQDLKKSLPAVMSDADAKEMEVCMITKLTTAIPGGPLQAEELGQARLEEIARQGGFACAQEYSTRLSTQERWTPQVAALFDLSCVKGGGEQSKPFCSCMSRQAQKQYATPAEFTRVVQIPEGQRTMVDRRKFDRLLKACSR